MKAFVSIHSFIPEVGDMHELSYEGYARQEIEYFEGFAQQPLDVLFSQNTMNETICVRYLIIHAESGEILKGVEVVPNLMVLPTEIPKITITDIIPFPEGLHPIAAVAWELDYRKMMNPAELPPQLYEAINIELQRAGMPVIKCTRTGTAELKQCFKSLSELSDVLGNA